MSFIQFLLFSLLTLTPSAHAVEYQFQSNLDQFFVDVTDGVATFEGHEVSAEPFKVIQPLFETKLVEECGALPKKADLTITRKAQNQTDTRSVYIEKRIVSDGKNCVKITGQGIYALPLHKNWFINNNTITIDLKNNFGIFKNNLVVVEFEKADGQWRNKDSEFFTNWRFFEQFVDALKKLPVDYRVHASAAKEPTQFELRVDKKTYKFVKVSEKTWAVLMPGAPWYVASGHLGFLDDMEQTQWISPLRNQLKMVKDPTASVENRIAGIRALSEKWEPDVKYTFYSVLATKGENPAIIRELAAFFRGKPTDENYSALVTALEYSTDVPLQIQLTKILRIRNPKGAVISDSDDEATIKKKIAEWSAWKKNLKRN